MPNGIRPRSWSGGEPSRDQHTAHAPGGAYRQSDLASPSGGRTPTDRHQIGLRDPCVIAAVANLALLLGRTLANAASFAAGWVLDRDLRRRAIASAPREPQVFTGADFLADFPTDLFGAFAAADFGFVDFGRPRRRDRKSTRLNSSHMSISYAVFCLKKKKN